MEEAQQQPTTITIGEDPSRETLTIDSEQPIEEAEEAETSPQLSLVDIHRAVLSRLFPSHTSSTKESLQERLNRLKRKRVYLACELEQRKHSVVQTVSDELDEWRTRTRERRPHHHAYDLNGGLLQPENNKNPLQDNLADCMHALRTKRRIAGAHRLAGISVVPCPNDEQVLGVRLDICVNGRYVNRHYVFLKIQNDETLKIVQHTVPQGVPLLQTTQEGMPSVDGVRKCIGDVYDGCYCHAVKQDACDFLKTHEKVHEFKCTAALDSIVFSFSNQGDDIQVRLEYSDPFSALPTSVDVSRALKEEATAPGGEELAQVRDEEDSDILATAKNTFLTCGIREALDRIKNDDN